MRLQKIALEKNYIYHYTTLEHAQQILNEHIVRCYHDNFTFFTASYHDAVKVCHNVMKEGALYIDNTLSLRRRGKISFDNYVILKLKCPKHTNFYQLLTDHPKDTFSVYDYALMHHGDLKFTKGKILPLKTSASPVFGISIHKVAAISSACLLLASSFSTPTYAASGSWSDAGNYN